MKPHLKTVLLVAVAASAIAGPPVRAQHAHEHGHVHGDSHGTEELPKIPQTVPDAWKIIHENLAKIQKAAESNNHDVIHNAEPYIQAGLNVLKAKSTMVEEKNQARLQGAIKQASKAGDAIHHAADDDDKAGLAKSTKQLAGALKLIEAQYPAGTLPQLGSGR